MLFLVALSLGRFYSHVSSSSTAYTEGTQPVLRSRSVPDAFSLAEAKVTKVHDDGTKCDALSLDPVLEVYLFLTSGTSCRTLKFGCRSCTLTNSLLCGSFLLCS